MQKIVSRVKSLENGSAGGSVVLEKGDFKLQLELGVLFSKTYLSAVIEASASKQIGELYFLYEKKNHIIKNIFFCDTYFIEETVDNKDSLLIKVKRDSTVFLLDKSNPDYWVLKRKIDLALYVDVAIKIVYRPDMMIQDIIQKWMPLGRLGWWILKKYRKLVEVFKDQPVGREMEPFQNQNLIDFVPKGKEKNIFSFIAAQSCEAINPRAQSCNSPNPSTIGVKIAFKHRASGCFEKAHKMREIIETCFGYKSYKIFSKPEGLKLICITSLSTNWSSHGASLLLVGDEKEHAYWVIDPTLFDEPVSIEQWRQAQSCGATCSLGDYCDRYINDIKIMPSEMLNIDRRSPAYVDENINKILADLCPKQSLFEIFFKFNQNQI